MQIVRDSSFETKLDQNFERENPFVIYAINSDHTRSPLQVYVYMLKQGNPWLSMNVILNDSEIDKDD